ncbi:MAG: hypothetical protein HY660_18740 [Armatimonadetes bacterium]|nr:hypothetical protein [Armatimonadota bacterium]
MIRLCLHRSDLSLAWQPDQHGWRAGCSHVAPFLHPAIEAYAVASEAQTLFVVRERLHGNGTRRPAPGAARGFGIRHVRAGELRKWLAEAEAWPLDSILVLVSRGGRAGTGTAELRAGSRGTAPVYLVESGDTLWGDWDPVALYAHMRDRSLRFDLASHFLISFGTPYSRQTLFPRMQRLTERAHASWGVRAGPAGAARPLIIAYPPALEPPRPGSAVPSADVVGAFGALVAWSMRRWIDAGQPAIYSHLSGGLDSGTVAGVGASLVPGAVHTFGLIMPGSSGAAQQRRRHALVRRFRFVDWSWPAVTHLPLTPRSRRVVEHRVVPWEECYVEAFEVLLQRVRARGGQVLFTGSGGDELTYLQWAELDQEQRRRLVKEIFVDRARLPSFVTRRAREAYYDTFRTLDRAPAGAVPSSVFDASAAVAPLYLSHGIWPVHPLGMAEVYRFCQTLPAEWRKDRALARRLLKHLGCPASMYQPRSHEDFGPVMESSLCGPARPLFERLFKTSRLADLELIDGKRLVRCYEDYCAHGPDARRDTGVQFYGAAVLELALRVLDAAHGAPSAMLAGTPASR